MVMPKGIGIVDTMIGFPANDFSQYDFMRKQLKDGSTDLDFPVEYMFKNVPKWKINLTHDTNVINKLNSSG